MAANQNIARLGIVLGLETGEYTREVNAIIQANKSMASQVNSSVKSIQREIEDLSFATENYGKVLTKTEQIEENIKRLRYTEATVGPALIKQLRDQAAAYDAKAAAAKRSFEAEKGGAGKLSTYQLQALSYQTTDIITSLAGGQNPMLVLLQQGGQLKDQFGGLTNVFKAFKEVLSFTKVTAASVALTLGTMAYAIYKGYQDLKEFNNTLALTGNYAGVTRDSFFKLADTLSDKLNISVGESRDIFKVLVSSGKFTQESMYAVAEAIAKVSKLSGESADVVAKELMPGFAGTAAAAASLNEKYHFLNLSQYKYIEQLEKQGLNQKAAAETAKALNEALDEEARKAGYILKTWNAIKDTVTAIGDALGKWGTTTGADRIAAAEKFLRIAKSGVGNYSEENVRIAQENLDRVKKEVADEEKLKLESAKKIADQAAQTKKYQDAGGADKERALRLENEKILNDSIFQDKVDKADKFVRIQLESEKRIKDYALQQDQQDYQEKYVFHTQHEKNKADFAIAEAKKVRQQIDEINRQQFKQYNDALIAEKSSVEVEREKLELYKENILLSDTDYQIAIARKETEKDIARYKANKELTEAGRQELIDKKKAIMDSREEVIRMGESLKLLKDINQSVFKNMSDAIANFVLTGKLNFKSFAGTVIMEILRIQAAALAAQATRGIFGLFGGSSAISLGSMALGANAGASTGFGISSSTGGLGFNASSFGYIPGKAVGGSVSSNSPYLVGENGPELFIPRNSGTIIPNGQMGQALGSTTNVTNYYIDAIDTKSFEQRILGSSNAVWAANQYANNKTIATSRSRT